MRLILAWVLLAGVAWADTTYVKETNTVLVEQVPVTQERRYTISDLNAKRADYVAAIAEIDALLAEAEKLGVTSAPAPVE